MKIDKEQVLQLLREQGQHDQAAQAQQELPDQVDTEEHASVLGKYNLDPGQLIGKFGGGLSL